MLLANYGSDSESGSDNEAGPSSPKPISKTAPAPAPAPARPSAPGPAPAPPAAKSKRKGPVKITLDAPIAGTAVTTSAEGDDKDGSDDEREVKKPKLGPKGKGSSALLGMLPPPKRKIANTSRSALAVNKSMAKPSLSAPKPPADDDDDDEEKPGLLLPASVARSKAKAKAAEPPLDLFGLSSNTSTPSIPSSSKPSLPTAISSAPSVPDFVPPPPSANDPYPGYYQTPTGQWKAYDPEYYASFFSTEETALQGEKDENDGRVGRHWDEFDTKGADIRDVDVKGDIAKAQEEERLRNLAKRPKLPSDDFQYETIGQIKGVAAQRHQLTSLLHTAYSSREELEDRIAQNKKNMRLAGAKYGF